MVAEANLVPEVAKELIAPLLKSMVAALPSSIKAKSSGLLYSIEPHLGSQYQKCKYFKSVLASEKPLDITEYYLPIEFIDPETQKRVDHAYLLNTYSRRDRIVVTGLAGSGKSMFMKKLTLDLFEADDFSLPIFIELKSWKKYGGSNFIEFIMREFSIPTKQINLETFTAIIGEGRLNFVFDGFDELENDAKEVVADLLKNFSSDFPKVGVIVSSRPDARFSQWVAFHVFKVAELTNRQTSELIKNLPYDQGVKERFLAECKSRLFSSHKSFLSSPLLCSIMLLTFETYAKIPTNMTSFYSKAFDTLFEKHDAAKEQFTRKLKLGLDIDSFKVVFSAFCAMSYVEERFYFDDEKFMEIAGRALDYASNVLTLENSLSATDFRDDLFDCVCMLQRDGLNITFVHRSFQEYFAAVFVDKCHGEQVPKILDQYAIRFQDSVISMALSLAPDKVEQEWVVPRVRQISKDLEGVVAKGAIGRFFSRLFDRIKISVGQDVNFYFQVSPDGAKYLGIIESICRCYRGDLGPIFLIRKLRGVKVADIALVLTSEPNTRRKSYSILQSVANLTPSSAPRRELDIVPSDRDSWWMKSLGVADDLSEMVTRMRNIEREIEGRKQKKGEILAIFGI